jgi:NAD(P)-dependent dehydrogenase (short-subunit alcohol dehydrogenase family)
MSSLEGKCALVTGSSRGIGRGIALRLAERGARVAVNYVRDEAAATQTLQAIQERGASGFTVRADVSKPDEVSALAARVKQEFGTLDILVNNALGNLLGFFAPPHAVSMEQWDEAFQCQPRAFFSVVRELSALLQERGRIVAISFWPGSQLGGFQPYFAMGANKAAIEAMCRFYAVAFAKRGITVNAVCAGITDDSIVNALPKEAQDALLNWLRDGWNPMGRARTPADIAGAVAALCSDDAGCGSRDRRSSRTAGAR